MSKSKLWMLGTIVAAGVTAFVLLQPDTVELVTDWGKSLITSAVAGVCGGISALWAQVRRDKRCDNWVLRVVNPPKDRGGNDQAGWHANLAPDHIAMLYASQLELFKQRLGTCCSATGFFRSDIGSPLDQELPAENVLWTGNGQVEIDYDARIVTVDYSK